MKSLKTLLSPQTILAIILLGFGVPYIILKMSGYMLVPVNRLAPAVMSTLITALIVFLSYKSIKPKRKTEQTRASFVILLLIPLFAVIFVIGKAIGYETDDIELILLPIYACIVLLCGISVFFARMESKKLRISLGAAYCVFIIPMIAIILYWDFSPNTVVAAELSPNGAYLAEIAHCDQGVFGSSTLVRITRQGKDVNLPIGVLRKDPAPIYKGAFSEYKTMIIKWESDETLYINEQRVSIR